MLRSFISAATNGDGVTGRRGFLKSLGVAAGAGALTLSWRDMLLARSKELQKSGKRMILLWMDGGPPHTVDSLAPETERKYHRARTATC